MMSSVLSFPLQLVTKKTLSDFFLFTLTNKVVVVFILEAFFYLVKSSRIYPSIITRRVVTTESGF